jgi:DUF2993 family protein
MRAVRILLIVVVVIGGLFTAADRAAVYFAEGQVADKIQQSQGLSDKPKVSIRGFPFLTQVARSSLQQVDVTLNGTTATAGGHTVQVTALKGELKDVRVNSSFSAATATRATGSAKISYADLSASAPKGASVAYAGPEQAAKGRVKISGNPSEVLKGADVSLPADVADALNSSDDFSTYATVTLASSGTIQVLPDRLPDLPVPGLNDQIRTLLDYDLKIDKLPASIKLDKVTATTDGLQFSGVGSGVSLAG